MTTAVSVPVNADCDLLALHAARPDRYPYLLESAAHAPAHGRYDLLFAFPGASMWVSDDGHLHDAPCGGGDFLAALDAWWQSAAHTTTAPPAFPFEGGWFVYLGYELAQQIEPTLSLHRYPDWPVAFATRIPAVVVRDHLRGTSHIVVEAGAEGRVADIAADLARHCSGAAPLQDMHRATLVEEPATAYIEAVEHARRYIFDGDIFQANLSREWRTDVAEGIDDSALYARLRNANPGPFAGLVHWRGNAILSSSPERLVEVRGRHAATRPIAGTRPRSRDVGADRALIRELIAHPKERAEHIMLIDLERNDLGRVCVAGSVEVDQMMVLETYAHVHHIVSNVTGVLREDVTPGEVIRAVFPGGTITGCPKVRCMQIIDELEGTARGPYTGSIGYLGHNGDCDFNILIRTVVRNGSQLSVRAGAGIVADSVASREVEETRAKARGMLLALGMGEAA